MATAPATPNSRKNRNTVRDRLLGVATSLFAAAGFDGTTVDAIVAKAGVNKRMVYHYFGSKDDLYHAVLAEAYRSLELMEISTFSQTSDLAALTEKMVRTYFDFLASHPEFSRLLLWENLNNGRGLAGANFQFNKDPMLGALDKFLRAGMYSGLIRRDMDARHLLISLIGLCQIYSSNRYTLSRALRMDLGSSRVREEGIVHVTRLFLEGIGARKATRPKTTRRPAQR